MRSRTQPGEDPLKRHHRVRISAGAWYAAWIVASICPAIAGEPANVADVEDEPHHKLVFENAAVRLLDVEIPPQTSTDFHRHRRDNAAVVLSEAEIAVQPLDKPKSGAKRSSPGAVVYTASPDGGYAHRVVNEGHTTYRVIDVELLRPTGHATLADNKSIKASFENDRLRVYTVLLEPGETSQPLVLGPGVLLLTPGATLDLIGSHGRVDHIGSGASRWRWREAGSYSLRNGTSERALGVQLEIK